MKKSLLLLFALMVMPLAAPLGPADAEAAQPQDVMAGYWVLTFEDGRTGWANLVSDDYPKTGFSSKGKIEVPGFKQTELTSGVIPEYYKEGQVILYNPQAQQKPFHFVWFVLEGKGVVTGYVATFDGKQYKFRAHRR